ncbi:MAG: PilC/PilY family type IV pilus protein [Betaproteobacteria bacterium]|nr:PilC/PilY family type IV pilus protein [Betaproteobacteria bacterium]
MKRSKQPLISVMMALSAAVSMFAVSSFAAPPYSPVKISDNPSRMLFDPTRLVPTNIVLLADDSGSMLWAHAPNDLGDIQRACWRGKDEVLITSAFSNNSCDLTSDPSCYVADVCGYPYPNPYPGVGGGTGSGYPSLGLSQEEIAIKVLPPPLMTTGFNNMAYHPEVNYLPPVVIDKNGNKLCFPSMDSGRTSYVDANGNTICTVIAGSSSWTAVGWPTSVAVDSVTINSPSGAPVTVDMANVTTKFPKSRTYTPDQIFSLQYRYMSGATLPAQMNLISPAPMPMHYFKTSVKWCRYYQATTTSGDGTIASSEGAYFLGSASPADCQDNRTDVYKYPYYYAPNGKYTIPNKENHVLYPSFELVVLDYSGSGSCSPSPVQYTYVDATGTLQTGSRTCQQELENYANWYAYYGNRAAATRTTASWALAGIDPDRWLRIGVATVNNMTGATTPGTYPYNMDALTDLRKDTGTRTANQTAIFKALLEYPVDSTSGSGNKGTPLKQAVYNIYNTLNTGTDKNTRENFVCRSCQRNYVMALSDGGWNDSNTVLAQDQDSTVASGLPPRNNVYEVSGVKLGMALASSMTWPPPIHEGPSPASPPVGATNTDTFADMSLYAWLNELRNSLKTYDVDGAVNDEAGWKHLNTQALAYAGGGTQALAYAGTGVLSAATNHKTALQNITNSVADWAWPVPAPTRSTVPSSAFLWPRATEDLWHATISGGSGKFSYGIDPQKDFGNAIDTDLNNIFNRGMSFSDLGLPPSRNLQTNGACGAGDSNVCVYTTGFTPGWGGVVLKRWLDPAPDGTIHVIWNAEEVMANQVAGLSLSAVNNKPTKQQMKFGAPWVDKRNIFTATQPASVGEVLPPTLASMGTPGGGWSGGTAADFTYSAINTSYGSTVISTILGTTNVAEQTDMINYLRGDWTNEESPAGGKYRKRERFLGDFIRSSPVVVDPPNSGYSDKSYGDPATPSTFAGNNSSRKRMIFASGNDGMLHAFDDDTGVELWAFVPPDLIRPAAENGIVNLTTSTNNSWTHYYYIDATPRVIDVNINDPSSSSDWRTMLIGGMGKGGTAYYALDVTNGDSSTSGTTLFKWTFTDDNMGYTYGRALMVRTKATNPALKDKWVAILPSGINNGTDPTGAAQAKTASEPGAGKGDGQGRIFFVDVATGQKIFEISTGVGTPLAPSGLAYIRAFVNTADQYADAVYGGDQLGNLWRFDLSDPDYNNWKAVKLAVLTNGTDPDPLPVNTEPQMDVAVDSGGSNVRWVMVGTGRFYDDADLYDWSASGTTTPNYSTMPKQGMFAIKDGNGNAPNQTLTTPYTLADLDVIPTGASTPILTGKSGWVEFFDKGYQVINNSSAMNGDVAYVVNRYVPGRGADASVDAQNCSILPFEGISFLRNTGTGLALAGNYTYRDGGLVAPNFLIDQNGNFKAIFAGPMGANANQPTLDLGDGRDLGGQPVDSTPSRRSSIRFISR